MSKNPMASLTLVRLNKTYNPKVIPVKDISLTVKDDEFLTLLGPSGCGKSTILRLIAGLEPPTHGQVMVGDRDVTQLPPGDRNIAMVFQSYALYPHMTVYENIAAGLKLRHLPPEEIQQRVRDVSQKLGLGELMQRKPGQLSGGQRQRIALGRALVRRPNVFLLDEPLSNLDALLREQVRADLKQIFDEQAVPVVYVTHDQTEAMTLSSKVAVLSQGEVQQLDTPDRIYRAPANQFVAEFIGSPRMNLLTLACEGHQAKLGDCFIPLPESVGTPRQVVLGIRPEQMRLASAGDTRMVAGRVYLVEHLGMHNLIGVHVVRSHGSPVSLRALLPADQPFGEEVELMFPTEALHWFDLESGKRLP